MQNIIQHMKRKLIYYVLLLVLTLLYSCSEAVQKSNVLFIALDDMADWVVELHEAHIRNDMPYRLMKPINHEPNENYPVIVSLHGGGGRGTDNLKQLSDWFNGFNPF